MNNDKITVEIYDFWTYIPFKSSTNYIKIMSVKISYSNKIKGKITSNIVLFSNDKFNISNLKKFLSNIEFEYIKDLLKNGDLKKIYLFMK